MLQKKSNIDKKIYKHLGFMVMFRVSWIFFVDRFLHRKRKAWRLTHTNSCNNTTPGCILYWCPSQNNGFRTNGSNLLCLLSLTLGSALYWHPAHSPILSRSLPSSPCYKPNRETRIPPQSETMGDDNISNTHLSLFFISRSLHGGGRSYSLEAHIYIYTHTYPHYWLGFQANGL